MKKISSEQILISLIFVFSSLTALALEGSIEVRGISKKWTYIESSKSRYSAAKSFCEQLNYRLPTVLELKQIYQMTLDSDGNSLLRGGNREVSIWSSNYVVTLDALIVFGFAAIPFPEVAHKALTVYRHHDMNYEHSYAAMHRYLLEGKAKILCIEK